jgi:phosphate-selective porin OprO and OprP
MASLEAQIERIEARHQAEIKSLQAEIRQLRRERPAAAAAKPRVGPSPERAPSGQLAGQGPPGVPAPALPPKVLMTYDRGYHFGFSDATGDNTIELFGRLQVDTGGYLQYKPGPETLDQKGLADGIDLRRARIGVIGNFMTDWHYAFVYDFGNTSDSNNPNNALANANSSTSPTTSNNFLAGVENAFITYNGFYRHGEQFPVAFDFASKTCRGRWTRRPAPTTSCSLSAPPLRSSPPSSAAATSAPRLTCARTTTAIGRARS